MDEPIGIILSPTKLSGGKLELTAYGDELYDRGEIASGSLLLVKESEKETHVILSTEIEDKNIVYEERSVYQALRKSGAEGVIKAEEADLRQVIMSFEIVGEIAERGGSKVLDRPLRPPKPGSKVYQLTKDHYEILFGEYLERFSKEATRESKVRNAISFGTISGSKSLKAIALWPNINMHLGIVGTTGSGKSFTAGAIIEKIALFKRALDLRERSMLVFDVHGEYKKTYGNKYKEFLDADRVDYRKDVVVLRPIGSAIDEKDSEGIELKYFGIDFVLEEKDFLEESTSLYKIYTADEFTEIAKILYGAKTGAYRTYLGKLYEGVSLDDGYYSLADTIHEIAKRKAEGIEVRQRDKIIDNALEKLANSEPGSIASNTRNALRRALGTFFERIGKYLLYPEEDEGDLYGKTIVSPKRITEKLKEGSLIIVDLTESGKGDLDNTIRDILISYILRITYRRLAREFYCSEKRLGILIDEAQTFIPAKDYDTGAILTKRVVRSIASQGRKFGISLILISQRPSFMDQHVFSLMNSLIIHRTAMGDAERLVKTFGLSRGLVRVFSNLRTGEAFLYGMLFGNIPMKVRIVKGDDRKILEEREELLERCFF